MANCATVNVDFGVFNVHFGKVIVHFGKVIVDTGTAIVDFGKVIVDSAMFIVDFGGINVDFGGIIVDFGGIIVDGGTFIVDTGGVGHQWRIFKLYNATPRILGYSVEVCKTVRAETTFAAWLFYSDSLVFIMNFNPITSYFTICQSNKTMLYIVGLKNLITIEKAD